MPLPKSLSAQPLMNPVGRSSGGAASVTLNFVAQVQAQTNWCWAAVSTSVGLFYGTGNWTQCEVATDQVNTILDPDGNHDCCATPSSSTCNQYGYLNPALHHVDAYAFASSGKADADEIFASISDRREVVCVRVAWAGQGAHFTTIHGFTDPSLGSDVYLTVSDTVSGWGTTTMLYSEFPQLYQHGGTWTDTYWTRNVYGPSAQYGSGEENSAAIDNNANCVALLTQACEISSQVGKIDFIEQKIAWGAIASFGTGSLGGIDIDNYGLCVGVYSEAGRLHYRVGRINTTSSTIRWGTSVEYGRGHWNDIALTALDICVGVHEESGRLYYQMGWVEQNSTIDWQRQVEYGMGIRNAIAMNASFKCVQVHVGTGTQSGRLVYSVGKLDFLRGVIQWGANVEFDRGSQVDISFNNNLECRVVFVDDSSGRRELYYRIGTLDTQNRTVEWAPRTRYEQGEQASVGIDDSGKSVELHAASGRLLAKVGQ
ncbi:MAG: papain-like cysteine protease family protein [Planctomycetota bacterium]